MNHDEVSGEVGALLFGTITENLYFRANVSRIPPCQSSHDRGLRWDAFEDLRCRIVRKARQSAQWLAALTDDVKNKAFDIRMKPAG